MTTARRARRAPSPSGRPGASAARPDDARPRARRVADLLGQALLVGAGLVHALPTVGIVSGERLSDLYGIGAVTPEVELLLRHRAVFFVIVGAGLVAAAFLPSLRRAAIASAGVALGTYVALAVTGGTGTPELRRILWVDVGLLVALAAATALLRIGSPRCRVP